MKPLSSIDNPAVKALGRLLKDASARRESARAVVEGPLLAAEALKSGVAKELWVTPRAFQGPDAPALLALARTARLRESFLEEGLLRRLATTETPQGWLAVVEPAALSLAPSPSLRVALDHLQDPGNLGTLLRTAWACGASLLLGPGCADPWSPKVLRAGAGAQFKVAVETTEDLPKALRALPTGGFKVFGTGPRAALKHQEAHLGGPVCLVLGAEGTGLGADVAAACQSHVAISYPGTAESLNVAVAGAVLLFECLRQRQGFPDRNS
jgi:TrmH family RNA methyltransferase